MPDELALIGQVKSYITRRVARQRARADDDFVFYKPLGGAQIHQIKIHLSIRKKVGHFVQPGHTTNLIKRGFRLWPIRYNDLSFTLQGFPYIIRNRANHAPMRQHILPSFGVARVMSR